MIRPIDILLMKSGSVAPVPSVIGTYITGVFNTSNYTNVTATMSNPSPTTLRLVQSTHTLGYSGAYNNTYLTGRDNNTSTRRYIVNTKNSESWGIGPSLMNYAGGGSDYISAIMGNGAGFNDRTFYLWNGAGNVIASGANILPTPAVNDVIEVTLTVNKNVYTATAQNITQGSAVHTLTYSETYTSGVMKATRALCYTGTRLFGGDYTLTTINESTQEYVYSDVLLISNSKGVGAYCGAVANKAIEVVRAANPTLNIVNSSGFNDTTSKYLLKNTELLAYKAKLVILYDFTNDTRYGSPTGTNLDTLIATHEANGSIVVCINSTAEGSGGVNATTTNSIAVTKFIPAKYYDSYTPSQTAGVLKATYEAPDHIHLNALFNTTILQGLIQQAMTDWL